MAESTYPYLKGGVSAVMHDIIVGNPDLTFGILHIAWDSNGSKRDLYGMPPNVQWLQHVYLSMQEHRDDFMLARARSRSACGRPARLELAYRIFDALAAIPGGDYGPMWELYDAGINPRTRTYSLWPILGTKEFMLAAQDRLRGFGMPFVETFWLLREFFSLAYAILSVDVPDAAGLPRPHHRVRLAAGCHRGPPERLVVPAHRAQPLRPRHGQHPVGPEPGPPADPARLA